MLWMDQEVRSGGFRISRMVFCIIFAWNCMKMKAIGLGKGGGVCSSYSLDPPLSTVISLYAQTLPLTCEVYPSSVRCECVRWCRNSGGILDIFTFGIRWCNFTFHKIGKKRDVMGTQTTQSLYPKDCPCLSVDLLNTQCDMVFAHMYWTVCVVSSLVSLMIPFLPTIKFLSSEVDLNYVVALDLS